MLQLNLSSSVPLSPILSKYPTRGQGKCHHFQVISCVCRQGEGRPFCLGERSLAAVAVLHCKRLNSTICSKQTEAQQLVGQGFCPPNRHTTFALSSNSILLLCATDFIAYNTELQMTEWKSTVPYSSSSQSSIAAPH